MLLALDGYLTHEMEIHDLVGTLSFLLTHLESVSDDWFELFRDKWLLLEILNAESREENRDLNASEYKNSLEVVMVLKDLVLQTIERGGST